MTTVNREDFITLLETLTPGLTAQEVVEQSSCFVFKDERIITYNEEIACSQKSPVDFVGAVRAAPLLNYIRKLSEEEIDLEPSDGELIVNGKKRGAAVRMEKDILLPFDTVDYPKKWRDLPEEFGEAVSIVEGCAGKDATKFTSTCIHIHPKCLEACDNYQMIRYKMKTGFPDAILVRRDSLKHIVALAMSKVGETENWVHFKNKSGLVFSCRRSLEEYPDIGGFLKMKGEPLSLPKGLGEAADKAEVFSAEDADNNLVIIELKQGKLRIRGEGASGRAWEIKKVAYDGPSLKFLIEPKLLMEITSKHTDCEISDQALKITGERFVYVTCLGNPDEQKEEQEQEESEDE
jgi:hypothetical protein